jgi:hypothetical protein
MVLAIFSPANVVAGGLQNGGCAVFPMVSFDPPAYQKDCAGNPILRGRITGPAGAGSCTYDAAIWSGVITLANGGGFDSLSGSPLRPDSQAFHCNNSNKSRLTRTFVRL